MFQYFVSLVYFLSFGKSFADEPTIKVLPWQTGHLASNEGALAFGLRAVGFSVNNEIPIRIILRSTKENNFMMIHTKLGSVRPWRLTAGLYSLESLSFTDQSGSRYQWRAKSKPLKLKIKNQRISIAGLWSIMRRANGQVKLQIKNSKSLVRQVRQKTDPNVAVAIISGLTGERQIKLGGQQVKAQVLAGKNTPTLPKKQMATSTSSRFQLDLVARKAFTRKMANRLNKFDHKMTKCFADGFRRNLVAAKGHISFAFAIQGTSLPMHLIRTTGGNIADSRMQRCFRQTLASIPIPFRAQGVKGTVVYHFQAQTNI